MKEERNTRLRRMVRQLNQVRRSQKKQIDILCNDILSAHSDFINHLKNFQFVADFYENILGTNNPEQLAKAIGEYFVNNLKNINAAVVFLTAGTPQVHVFSTDKQLSDIPSQINPYLSTRMVQMVCQSGKICMAEELCKMEFFASPVVLKKISLAAIGLNKSGPALGMIILYRSASQPFSSYELTQASSIVAGLCTALKNMQNSDTICDIA